jgi:putative ABC transport system permease protein
MSHFGQDLRQAVRVLTRTPGFAFATVLMLAVGIGANTALFSVIDTVLLRDLPYLEPDRIVTIWEYEKDANARAEVSAPNFVDWKTQATSFDVMAGVEPFTFDYYSGLEPDVWRAGLVTEGFFDAIGARLLLGRTFAPDDYRPGQHRVVILGFNLWQSRFGGDRSVVGRAIDLDNERYTVVGVLPQEFQLRLFDYDVRDVWAPKLFRPNELTGRQARFANYWNVVARLKRGATLEQARAEMHAIAERLSRQYPTSNANTGIEIVPLHEQLFGHLKPALLVFLGAVGFVLLIACANVANLLLARGMRRGRELSIRAALGATRSRLIRQMLTESVVLAAVGCASGLFLAHVGIRLILGLAPGDVPYLDRLTLDTRMLAFAAGLSVLASILSGLAPAWQLSNIGLRQSLAEGGRTATTGAAHQRLRSALVIGEIALSLVLLMGASLLVRSFITLLNVDPGFRKENLLALQVFAFDRRPTAEHRAAFFRDTLARINSLPGVIGAAAVQSPPMFLKSDYAIFTRFTIEGIPFATGAEPRAYGNVVTPGYFRVMGIPVRAGHDFDDRDRSNTTPVALVNETVARREWSNESPIGKRIIPAIGQRVPHEIVGVVGDVRQDGLDQPARPEFYIPHAQLAQAAMTYVVRASAEPAMMMEAIKAEIWAVDKLQTFYRTETMEELIKTSFAGRRFSLILLATFATISLLLAVAGLYSVISFVAAQRTNEIGVRMAIGASGLDILRLVMRQAFVLVAAGIVVGIAAAFFMTRLLRGLLFGTSPTDPMTFGLVCVLLFLVAVIASAVPARRAARLDPLVALRYE